MMSYSERIQLAYDKLNSSGMAGWVGSGDPSAVGAECFDAISAAMDLRRDMKVIDFGCGIGRMSIPMADFLSHGNLVGIDIVPSMIEFCQQSISPLFPNASFLLSASKNPLYEKYKLEAEISVEDMLGWSESHRQSFDLIYAFSVFTHFDLDMAQSTLNLFSRLLKPSGIVFFTAFLDGEDNPADRKLRPGEQYRDCYEESLHWVVHDPGSILRMAHQAGFSPRRVQYGYWRGTPPGTIKGDTFQDVVVLVQPVTIPADFDPEVYVSLYPDLIKAGVDGTEHYRKFGYFEQRRYR